MFWCGWPPPATASDAVVEEELWYRSVSPDAGIARAGLALVAADGVAFSVWLCTGISDVSRVTVSLPPCSPRSCWLRPAPCPGAIATAPRRSGRANVDLPSPPYVVPSSENSAVFWLIGSSWPSHRAHPRGTKL